MTTAEQKLLNLISDKDGVDEDAVSVLYDKLQPLEPESMIGDWEGGIINTDFPLPPLYGEGKWAGKNFKSLDEVHPMVLYDEHRKRYRAEEYGLARLRLVKFRGVVSAALIYDEMPVIDSFRRLSDNMVVGAADTRMNTRTLYFWLKKIDISG